MESNDQFSAKFDQPFFGPVTEAPVRAVRDVVICVTDATVNDTESYRKYPPIASPLLRRTGGRAEPVSLGRGVVIDRLSRDDCDLVMNACTPRGHNFSPIRQFGQRYSVICERDPQIWERDPYRWDPDDVVWDSLTLSRLVRDNAYSTQYAARIVDYADGAQTVIYALGAESKHVYRLRQERDWLDVAEGFELGALLSAYWSGDSSLPARVRRAMWRVEYASWIAWADLALPIFVSGLEALLKTERHRATQQFVGRVSAIAEAVGIDAVTPELCERMYDARSEWVHGAHVRLFTTGPEAQAQGAVQAKPPARAQRALADIALMQDVLRAVVRRCIEDAEFRDTFNDDDGINGRWPA